MRYVLRIASTEFVLPPMYNAGSTVDALVRMLSMSTGVEETYDNETLKYKYVRHPKAHVDVELRTVRDDADEVVATELPLAGGPDERVEGGSDAE